ncbi:MAG: hypothetical protein AAF525_05030 [Pseudomonadota bacterium]
MRRIALVALLLMASTAAYAVPTVWAEQSDKKFFKGMLFSSSGSGHIKKFAKTSDEIPDLKRVGLLAFSVYQPATKKVKKTYTSGGIVYNSIYAPYISDEGVFEFTDVVYGRALPAMKESMQAQGIDLLLPEEYLDTPEKQQVFDNATFENSKTWKAVTAFINRLNAKETKAHPEGQKFVMIANADASIWRSVGKLAGDLDLDALLVVESTYTFDNGNQITLRKIDMSLIGPNTVPDSEKNSKKYAPFGPLKGYLEGVVYGNLAGMYSKSAILIARMKKDRYTETHFDGLGTIYGRIVGELLIRTNGEIEKLASRVK